MSRVGKKPIKLEEGVTCAKEGHRVLVKGPKGELSLLIGPAFDLEFKDNEIIVKKIKKTPEFEKFFGLTRTLIFNMVHGVKEGFEKRLEIHGVGYRASMKDKTLVLKVGFSHPVEIIPPEGTEIKVEKNTIIISGIDKQVVGEVAAKIRSIRKPEPYKGKGIKYVGEKIKRKAGKAAKAQTTE